MFSGWGLSTPVDKGYRSMRPISQDTHFLLAFGGSIAYFPATWVYKVWESFKKHDRFGWFYLALFILLSSLILLAGQVFISHARESLFQQALYDVRHIAAFKAEQVARWRIVRLNTGNALAINPAVAQWLGKLVQEPTNAALGGEILLWMKKMEGRYGYGDGALVTSTGAVVLAVKPNAAVLSDETRRAMLAATNTGAPVLSDLYLTTNALPARMALVVPFALPGAARAEPQIFHLLIRVNPYEYLFKLLQAYPVPTTSAEILLVRREQDHVLFLNESRFQKGTALSFRLPLSMTNNPAVQAVLGQTECADGVDQRGAHTLSAMIPIEKSPWFLVVKQDRDEVLAGLNHMYQLAWVAMLMAIAGVGFLLSLLALGSRLHSMRQAVAVETEFHRLLDHIGDTVFVKDAQGQVLLTNAMACQLYGYSHEEWRNLKTSDLLMPDELPRLPELAQRLERDGQIVFEVKHRRKDGTPIPVEVNVRRTVFRGQLADVAIIRDITKRRQTEADFDKQAQLLLTLINALPDVIYIKDPQHRFMLANNALAQHMGVASPSDLLGKTDHDFLAKDLADRFMTEERAVMTSGRPEVNHEERILWPDGRSGWFLISKVPLRDHAGQVVGLVGIGHNVTQRKQLAEQLQSAYERSVGLETAINRSPVVVVLRRSGLDSPLEYVSENVYRWGYRAEDLIGQPTLPWIHQDDVERVSREIQQQLALRATEFMLSYRLMTGDGEVRWVEDHTRVLGDATGAVKQAQSLIIDVTTHRELEQELQQAQKMETIGRLAGGIAHDFNNLLQVILGFSELLATDMPETDVHRRDVREIQTAAQRAKELTSRLLAFSRKQMIMPTITDLNLIIASEREMLARILGEDIKVQTDLTVALWPVKVDQGQMQQIILNLAVNARDAMPEGGRFVLTTRNVTFGEVDTVLHSGTRAGRFVCLAISDTGVGMTPEVRAHLFEPFFTTKAPGQGTGLGLAMTYGIVKQHEGWIHVYSQLGQGSTLKLYLPAVTDATDATPAPAAQAGEPVGNQRVLLVEDEDGVRNLAARILRARGYLVTPARNAAEAEAIWSKAEGQFDVVLSDVVLPDGNGLDLVERWTSSGSRSGIILSSGYTDERARWPHIAERGYLFLQKPYPASELLRIMAEAVAKK